MTGAPGHFCPGCGAPLGAFLRYPWHFCAACRDSAVDGAGRGLLFGNEGLSGGFMFRYAEDAARGADGGWIACRGVIARIAGRPVRITEARFGGVVAEPIRDGHLPAEEGVVDLRRGDRVVPTSGGGTSPGRPGSRR